MKFAIVQIVRPDQAVYYLTHDPFRTIQYSLESMGHEVICVKNTLVSGRINILTTAYNLDAGMANHLLQSNIDYIIYQTEVLSDLGINAQIVNQGKTIMSLGDQERLRIYLQVLANARMVWECFRFNQEYLDKLKVDVSIIRHGYHPLLEGLPKKKELDIDLLFFGSLTSYRRKILQHLKIKKFKIEVLSLEPPYYRDDHLRRCKINLSIRTDTQYMTHLPHFRVITALYHNTLTVSEHCSEQAWMNDMVMMVPPEELVSTCTRLLKSGEWAERATVCRANFLKRPMTDYMEPLIVELAERLKNGAYALRS